MEGKLGSAVLTAATPATVYTAPTNCKRAEVNINILNGAGTDATIEMGITSAGSLAAADYIEDGVIVPSNGGTLEHTSVIMSPGEKIIITSSLTNVVVRVSGKEIVN